MVVRFGGAWLRAELRRSRGRDQVLGSRGLASLGPFLGAPAGSPGQVKKNATQSLEVDGVRDGDCGVPVPQSLESEVIQLVRVTTEQIVVCQHHRS